MLKARYHRHRPQTTGGGHIRPPPEVVQGTKPKAYAGLPLPSISISLTANPFSTRHSTTLIWGLTYSSFCIVFKYFF